MKEERNSDSRTTPCRGTIERREELRTVGLLHVEELKTVGLLHVEELKTEGLLQVEELLTEERNSDSRTTTCRGIQAE